MKAEMEKMLAAKMWTKLEINKKVTIQKFLTILKDCHSLKKKNR